MTVNLLTFVDVPQKRPDKRAADLRSADFEEIFNEFVPERAGEQAARCSQCGIPFCQVHCPLHNNIPDWLKLTAEGRLEEAYELAAATNTFPEICGRICPQDRLCEGNCVIEKGFESVTIGAVERYITETAFKNGWVSGPQPREERSQSIGIIGGGPAGLAAADVMRRYGYQVEVYDRHDRIGGLLIYGIPSFKLEKDIVERRADLLAASGVVFHTSTEIGRDISFGDLQARHDAVLIATGVYGARDIKVPGVGLDGVVDALDYLIASNRNGLGDAVPDFDSGMLDAAGKHVVVIGGGDTAMDCVRTAARQGAKAVTCLYRRDRNNMPGSQREVSYAMEEGVRFEFLSAPEAFLGDGTVEAVRAVKMRLGEPDETGRLKSQIVTGSDHNIEADLVLKALGFDPEPVAEVFELPALDVTRWGTVKTRMLTGETSLPGVYAAGDIVRGASLVVWAIRDGRDAAEAMHRELETRAEQNAPIRAAG
ncbi:MAG: NAD(P)-dependent oxidoreductase [Alphaproteobacteria bacterium]|jgi:glutamate synthase (NADPH) small chain|nr:NAD(P)-dependent oxidoreductase [Rhodospirillaceae bacterium]MBT6206067.1 NAD(P)-dependent oxidoreductase [Rhodospirillaceae bacterium]MBT6511533.1 NAD(P)-dependent oxidoreductase [Rhodospirillaceae bacterium]MBT7649216.1 NAD(P)-dependent oxidoreductase [Rhodospirillaceae bacterium]MDG2480734.1 NAD(P)-dependent oxidoreductase [Alphaproteobacteria bacterium]